MYSKYINSDGLKITLPLHIYEAIKVQINKFYPVECGGIFVGKVINNTAFIEQMMMPKKFSSTRVWFLRVSDFLNSWLSNIFTKSSGESIYLGEWHSHCDAPPMPSIKDLNTMRKIAADENTRIQTPLMLIVGYDKIAFVEHFYILFNQELIPFNKLAEDSSENS